jgi:hypothetical protein
VSLGTNIRKEQMLFCLKNVGIFFVRDEINDAVSVLC